MSVTIKTAPVSTHTLGVAPSPAAHAPAVPPSSHAAAPATFEALFHNYAPFVWRALRRLGVRERDCEDLLQEVFLTVHKQLPGFRGHSSVRTWVYGICLRKALDYRRLARMSRELEDPRALEATHPPTQEHALELQRARGRLDALLDTLTDDQRAVFVLFEWEGLPMQDIASLMQVPLQTCYARLYAARKHVLAGLSELATDGAPR